jgi:hypothetical protein
MRVSIRKGMKKKSLLRFADYGVLEWCGAYLRLVDDDGAPPLFRTRHFLVTDSSVSVDWIVHTIEAGRVLLSTPIFLKPGYFEDVFDSVSGSDEPILESRGISVDEKIRFQQWFDERMVHSGTVGALRRLTKPARPTPS